MSVVNAIPATRIRIPIGEGTNQPFRQRLWTDERFKTADTDKSYTVRLVIENPGGSTTYGYALSSTSTGGLWTTTITGTNHTTLGEADAQTHVDGTLKARYKFDFVPYL